MARWASANVFETLPGGRRLWRFTTKGDRFAFEKETTLTPTEPAGSVVAKDWQTVVNPKLNLAWLPGDRVFLRAVQLPGADAAELTAMVELQLEKLSPLPVTHIVWSYYVMPRQAGSPEGLHTVIVILAALSFVEELLGQLEAQGFMTDRLEAPRLDQLLATKFHDEGAWIFVGEAHEPILIAWWSGGTLQNISLIGLPEGPERPALLKAHIEQVAWAGELEGWLTGTPAIHLVAGPVEAHYWTPLLEAWAGPVDTSVPPTGAQLAAMSAERCANDDGRTTLLPADFKHRYRQQFVDTLWMRALFGAAAIYMVGVLIYFAALYTLQLKVNGVQAKLHGISITYTNALRDQEQIRILTDRAQLKYAALDCWKSVAENLPDGVTIDDLYFVGSSTSASGLTPGQLKLSGTAQSDAQDDVIHFNESLRAARDNAHQQPLFSEISPGQLAIRGPVVDWRFGCTLRNNEQ